MSNSVNLDNITYETNETILAISNNTKIEDKLNVIMVLSNACQYSIRYILAKQFIKRLEDNSDIILYIVELAYNDQDYYITSSNNSRHLQLRTEVPLWHKENLINIGVKYLLPENWKAFAWIDADIEFDNITWASDTLKILNNHKDIVQVYSHCDDLNYDGTTMRVFNSAGYQYTKKNPYSLATNSYWHSGYAWAINREGYEKIGGIYEYKILGGCDNLILNSILKKAKSCIDKNSTEEFIQSIQDFEERISTLRFGYVPGLIRHHFHGSKINRGYNNRGKILFNHKYNPLTHLCKDEYGLLIPSKECPQDMIKEIKEYFYSRKEDEFISKQLKSNT